MAVRRHRILVGIMMAFLMMPLVSLGLFGPEAPYGQRPETRFPSLAKFLRSESARLQLADAVVERLPVRKALITLNNFVLDGLGMIDDDRIVSGRGRWLFYKPQFEQYACGRDALFDNKIDRLVFMAGVARLTGFDYTIAFPPNKASIVPDRMSARARLYAPCYAERRAHVARRVAAAENPVLLDHGATLLGYPGDRRRLFLAGDTHWTSFGGAFAIRDLAARARSGAEAEIVRSFGLTPAPGSPRDIDLRTAMLLLPGQERDPVAAEIDTFASRYGNIPGRTVIVHDSFYVRLRGMLEWLYGDATLLHQTNDAAAVPAAFSSAERIVISVVERSILNRLYSDVHGWRAPIGQHIAARSAAAAAETCTFGADRVMEGEAPPARATLHDLTLASDGTYTAQTADPSIELALDAPPAREALCVRIRLLTKSAGYLRLSPERPASTSLGSKYSHGWSMEVAFEPGETVIAAIVPTTPTATSIRIAPASAKGDFRILSLQLGEPR